MSATMNLAFVGGQIIFVLPENKFQDLVFVMAKVSCSGVYIQI